jgi:putative acetyltransferase
MAERQDETARPPLQVRAARPLDAEAISALQNLPGVRFGTLQLPYRSPEDTRRWLEASAETRRTLLAIAGNVLVGLGDLSWHTGRRAQVGEIGMMVHDAWLRRGVGSRLLGELVAMADRWLGLRRLELTVYTDNAAAIALYRKAGFVIEGTHRAYALRDGNYIDAHTMARVIEPGTAG